MRKRGLGGLVVGAIAFLIFLGYRIDYKYDAFSQLVVRSDPLKEIKEGCECQGENFCFPGLDESLNRKYGQSFPCEYYKYLIKFHLTESDISRLKTNGTDEIDDNWVPVFASAVSSNHFSETRSFVLDIRKWVPNSKTIIYDLGLEQKEINEIQSWCNVEYRKFDYANHPPHFRNLLNYAFKIVIAEILRTERNFFFYDSSVRLDDNLHKMIPKAIKEGKILPFMNFNAAWHSVYATLANGTLDYIPLPNEVLYAREYQSILFISDSAYTRRFIRWFSLCALTEDCISPKGAVVNCTLKGDPLHDKMNCHRYDQNLWNMIHLEYLFDPIERGAISLGLVDKWGNGTEFIRKVLRERDSRYLRWGSKFLVVRAGSQTPIKVECAEQANSSTTAVLKEILL